MSGFRTRSLCAGMLVFAALLTPMAEALAQVSPFRRVGLNLSKEDLGLLETAGAKLYATDTPKVGATETWSNAKSGNAGTIVLIAVYSWNNMPCRRMSHQITSPSRKDPHSVQVDRCRTPAGEWKIRY